MRAKTFINNVYFLSQNPFPEVAMVSWGSPDERTNGSLFNPEVYPDSYEEAIVKFIVNPVDSGSKFHFLWSLGDSVEARGFGKTALLHYLARTVNSDMGHGILTTHGFEEQEARDVPILAAMAAFDTTGVTTLAGISLEQVKYLLPDDSGLGPLNGMRSRLLERIAIEDGVDVEKNATGSPLVPSMLTDRIKKEELAIGGKTIGATDKRFVSLFAAGDFSQLKHYMNETSSKNGFELLHTMFVIARGAGVRRIFLLIDQVEDFANADVPRKRRHMEVERFRDLAIETQPFGEMASYVLTMHPDAARSVEEFWSLARLPKIDHASRQNERVTVVLRRLENSSEAAKLLLPYLDNFRQGQPPHALFPFTNEAIEVLLKVSGGRPGEVLKRAHGLIAEGSDAQWKEITAKEVRLYFADEQPIEEAVGRRGGGRLGAVEGTGRGDRPAGGRS